jgi:hypothetical protein
MTKLLLNYLSKHAKAVYWTAILLLCDWSISLFLNCEVGEKQAVKCAEEYYGLTKTITYRLVGGGFDFVDTHAPLIAAAATIAIAWFTLTLKKSTDRLWEASEKQIGLFQKSTEATLKHAEIAEKSFGLSSKADFGFLTAPSNKIVANQKFTAGIKVMNLGSAHAYNVSARVLVEIKPPDTAIFKIKKPEPGRKIFLGKSDRAYTGTTDEAITQDQIAAISNGRMALFIIGIIAFQSPADSAPIFNTVSYRAIRDQNPPKYEATESTIQVTDE